MLQTVRRRQEEPTQNRIHHHVQVSGTQQNWKAQVSHLPGYSHRYDRTKGCWNQRSPWWWQLIMLNTIVAHAAIAAVVVVDVFNVEGKDEKPLCQTICQSLSVWSLVIYQLISLWLSFFFRFHNIYYIWQLFFCCCLWRCRWEWKTYPCMLSLWFMKSW